MAIIFLLFSFVTRQAVIEEQYQAACQDSGYAMALHKGNGWYCLSFGDEPRIEKLMPEVVGYTDKKGEGAQ